MTDRTLLTVGSVSFFGPPWVWWSSNLMLWELLRRLMLFMDGLFGLLHGNETITPLWGCDSRQCCESSDLHFFVMKSKRSMVGASLLGYPCRGNDQSCMLCYRRGLQQPFLTTKCKVYAHLLYQLPNTSSYRFRDSWVCLKVERDNAHSTAASMHSVHVSSSIEPLRNSHRLGLFAWATQAVVTGACCKPTQILLHLL